MSTVQRILVYGGNGALGDSLVNYFKSKSYVSINNCILLLLMNEFFSIIKIQKWIVSVDIKQNSNATENILVNTTHTLLEQEANIEEKLKSLLDDNKLDAILNVAGGWAGGNAAATQFLSNADLMWKQSVWSSLIASSLASKYLKEDGMMSLPGAAPALNSAPTPGMIGYGMAKAAVHQLTKSLANPKGGLPANAFVFALAPITLDTPMNRKWMPDADHSTWTPLSFVDDLMEKWMTNPGDRPANGSLVKLTTVNNETTLSFE
jgi:dihydropteridine reductase